MKRSTLFSVLLCLFSSLSAQLTEFPFSVNGGNGMPPYMAVNDTQYRLRAYVLNDLSGVKITFTSSNSEEHKWYRYRESTNNAIPISSIQDGNTSYIANIEDIMDGYGYFVGDPANPLTYYVWIIDYSRYVPRFFNLEVSEEEDKCTFLKILADVEAEPLVYYSPLGNLRTITRNYHLQYNTQEWDENNLQFNLKEVDDEWSGLIYERTISAPLMNTHFTLTGDQFAEHFGIQQAIRSDEYRAVAVEAHGIAETDKEHASNEKHHAGELLGGSAPIEYTFTAYANEPVAASYLWKIFKLDSLGNKESAIVRHSDKILRYNFDRDGIYRVELEVNGRQPVCVDTTQFFNIMIDNTMLKIPNAFSPGSSVGVNDELKISFTSVVSFKASVYNRWGNLLFQWSDPAKGWDGRVNGAFVPTGVYYVVVEYKDSAGKSRVASRAVNVLRAKN